MNNADMPSTAILELDSLGCYVEHHLGLTKREHFAGLAMQALLGGDRVGWTGWGEDLAKQSLEAADAILAELDKAKGEDTP